MVKLYDVNPMLDEDDLCAFGHVQEIASNDDILYTLDLIINLKIHHVHSHLACIHLGARLFPSVAKVNFRFANFIIEYAGIMVTIPSF